MKNLCFLYMYLPLIWGWT